ncbi:hypothetical protein Tco_1322655, partial [Tanacetum coccineum]
AQLVDTNTESEPEEAPSEDSTTSLSPDHPLTRTTPTRASFHRRTARMTVHAQPDMSPGHSARVEKAMTLSDSAFRKRYRSSYETPSPSPFSTLPVRKRYRGTFELILNTNSERGELGDKDTKEDKEDKSLDMNDKRERSEEEGHGLKEREEEVVPEG